LLWFSAGDSIKITYRDLIAIEKIACEMKRLLLYVPGRYGLLPGKNSALSFFSSFFLHFSYLTGRLSDQPAKKVFIAKTTG